MRTSSPLFFPQLNTKNPGDLQQNKEEKRTNNPNKLGRKAGKSKGKQESESPTGRREQEHQK